MTCIGTLKISYQPSGPAPLILNHHNYCVRYWSASTRRQMAQGETAS